MGRLDGKIALVTGASRGIGEAISHMFAAEGAIVWLTDINADDGHRLAKTIGSTARFAKLDVREEDDWQRITASVLECDGRIDVVVNNAGITGFEDGFIAHDPENASLEDWRKVH